MDTNILETMFISIGAFVRCLVDKLFGGKRDFTHFLEKNEFVNGLIGFSSILAILFILVRIVQSFITT